MKKLDHNKIFEFMGIALWAIVLIGVVFYGGRAIISEVINDGGCSIKGNISDSGEKIYHLKGQKYYDSTSIDTSNGERMFCTSNEAEKAGFRKSEAAYTQEYLDGQKDTERMQQIHEDDRCNGASGASRGC